MCAGSKISEDLELHIVSCGDQTILIDSSKESIVFHVGNCLISTFKLVQIQNKIQITLLIFSELRLLFT